MVAANGNAAIEPVPAAGFAGAATIDRDGNLTGMVGLHPPANPAAGAFFEWRGQDAAMNAAPGEFSVTALFEELTGGSRSSSANLNQGSSNRSSSPYAEKH